MHVCHNHCLFTLATKSKPRHALHGSQIVSVLARVDRDTILWSTMLRVVEEAKCILCVFRARHRQRCRPFCFGNSVQNTQREKKSWLSFGHSGKYGASYFSCAIRKTEAQAMQCYLGAAQRDLSGAATHVPSCFPPPGITQHPQDFFQHVHLLHEAWLETAPAQMALRSVSILWRPESVSSLETMGIA